MRLPIALCAIVALTLAAHAADWPQFLGPERSGISPETGLARSWPATGPTVQWTAPVGPGYTGVAAQGGKVYLMDRDPNERLRKDILRCLDLATGEEAWRFEFVTARSLWSYPGARSTPAVDDTAVYMMSVCGDLICVDKATHQPRWQHNIIADYQDEGSRPGDPRPVRPGTLAVPTWGISQSPLLYKDLVIVMPLSGKAGAVAYDKETGKVRWESPYCGRLYYCHASPMLTTLCGVDQVVVLGNEHLGSKPPAVVSGIDANTGKLLWQTTTPRHLNIPMPEPTNVGQDRLFITGGYRLGCCLLQVKHEDDRWSTAYLFTNNNNCTPILQTPIFYQGHLYVQSCDRPHNTPWKDQEYGWHGVNHGLECLNLDGSIAWETGKDDDMNSGGILIADGLIYAMDGNTGVLRLVEARADGYTELARAKVLEDDGDNGTNGTGFWAPLALSEGKLLVRDANTLKCLAVGRQQ